MCIRDRAERLKGHTSLALASQTVDRKWILTLITPQRKDADGNVTAVLVATRDATEEKRREQKQEDALRDALAAAEHANKAKTVFLNSMSHDIRTPMNAIIGFTALATAHIDNIDLVKEYLKKISVSGQHLLSLINDILDMSRIESGTVKLDNTEVHLPDVLHDLRTIIQGNISAKQLDLYIDTQDVHHEDIITDKLRLNQVLLNIVGNAVKFTPAGGTINIRVEEKPSARSGYATFVFSVKDNGIGMSKDFQAHVFDSFSREQTATRSGIQGTGPVSYTHLDVYKRQVLSRIFAYFATKEAAHSVGNEQLLTFKPAFRAFLSLWVIRHRHWLTGRGYAAVTPLLRLDGGQGAFS